MSTARVLLACLVVLLILVLALVPALVPAARGGGPEPAFGLAAALVGVAVLGLAGAALAPAEPCPIVGGRRPRRGFRARAGPAPPDIGMFAKLRARNPAAAEALRRIRRFFNSAGRGFRGGVRLAMAGPPGDAATLAEMRRAWLAHFPAAAATGGPLEPDRCLGRAAKRINELSALRSWGAVRDSARRDSAIKYLDVGSAEGCITAALAEDLDLPPGRAFACDVVPQPPNPRFEFRVADGRSLPFDAGEFGLESMFMSAHHFADPARVFAEAFRVARPGAHLLLREHGRDDDAAGLYYDLVHAFYETVARVEKPPERWVADYAAGRRPRYRTVDGWVAVAAGAGFALVEKTEPAADSFDTVCALFRKPGGEA